MRLFMFIVLFLLALQQYHLWFGKNGLKDNHRLEEEVTLAVIANKELSDRNMTMYSEIEDLKMGSDAIEERSRNELGLIKEGETFFHIIPKGD